MKGTVTWSEAMAFEGESNNYTVPLDAIPPIGKGKGMTPKELVNLGLAACTAMDVISLLKKYKQPVEKFWVESVAEKTSGSYPIVFSEINLEFYVEGNIDPKKLQEAILLSQTKFCGVSAMISKTVPIYYKVILNGNDIDQGKSNFS